MSDIQVRATIDIACNVLAPALDSPDMLISELEDTQPDEFSFVEWSSLIRSGMKVGCPDDLSRLFG